MQWHEEWCFSIESYMENLDRELKEGKTRQYLSKVYVERLYKLYYMVEAFNEKDDPILSKIQDYQGQQLHIIDHPEWDKIRRYAGETLQLILDDYEADIAKKPKPYF